MNHPEALYVGAPHSTTYRPSAPSSALKKDTHFWIFVMRNKNLLILTSRFPYEGGEYFLETEQFYWRKADGVDVYLIPFFRSKNIRPFPYWVTLKEENLENESRLNRFVYILTAFFSPIFFKEISLLYNANKLNVSNVNRALLTISRVFQIKKTIKLFAKEVGGIDLVYSYWNNSSAYAATLLKREGLVKKIVSRAHGTDLYRYALVNDYMPLKDQLASQFDLVATVSERGRDYFIKEYGVSKEKLIASRLGVEIDGRESHASVSNKLSVVSISNCVEIKRLEVIAAGILLYAKNNPKIDVNWTHIGDGPTLNSVKRYWASNSTEYQNATGAFLGRLANSQVIEFLVDNPIDLALNASASEGVPVSLMEAMSLGIPAVAPEIGGIPELISSSSGYLLPPMPEAENIAAGLAWGFEFGKKVETRSAAVARVTENYSASKNYSDFYNLMLSYI